MARRRRRAIACCVTVLAAGWLAAAAQERGSAPASRPAADATYRETAHSLTVDGRERTFIVHAPRDPLPGRALPVVFLLHGGGGRGERMAASGFGRLAARHGFLAVYPSGWQNHWNDGRGASRIRAQVAGVDDVKFLRAIVDDLEKRHRIDRGRIFASGVSNGGIFAHTLAARAADLFAGVAPIIGGLAEPVAADFRPSHPISLLVIQGDADALVPINGGPIAGSDRGGRIVAMEDMLRKYLAHNGIAAPPTVETAPDRDPYDGTTTLIRRYPPGRGGARVEVWLVRGGGHTVPGHRMFRSALLEARVGKTSGDFDAFEVIWHFFQSCPPRKAPTESGAR